MLVRRLSGAFGAEVLNLSTVDFESPSIVERLRNALFDHLILVVRNQELCVAELVALTKVFGTPEIVWDESRRHPQSELVQVISGPGRPSGSAPSASQCWHTDGSFQKRPPLVTLLASIILPEDGGDTQFGNTRSAYDALPVLLKSEVVNYRLYFSYSYRLSSMHSQRYGDNETPGASHMDVIHPLTRVHPVTGLTSLYLDQLCIARVQDDPTGSRRKVIESLYPVATASERFYRHQWQSGDLLIWDNTSLIHRRGEEHSGQRVMHRTTVAGHQPVALAADESSAN